MVTCKQFRNMFVNNYASNMQVMAKATPGILKRVLKTIVFIASVPLAILIIEKVLS